MMLYIQITERGLTDKCFESSVFISLSDHNSQYNIIKRTKQGQKRNHLNINFLTIQQHIRENNYIFYAFIWFKDM